MSGTKTVAAIQAEINNLSPHPEKVKLLAVSKKQPVDKLLELYNQNQFAFGENYVQEALEKIEVLPKDIEWHLIGHLQSKKVNLIVSDPGRQLAITRDVSRFMSPSLLCDIPSPALVMLSESESTLFRHIALESRAAISGAPICCALSCWLLWRS